MIGEFCREMAVLILVFVPLDLYRSQISSWTVKVAILGSVGLLALGMGIERMRE